MESKRPGKRRRLLLYRRSMDRIGQAALLLGLILGAAWAWETFGFQPLFLPGSDFWLLLGAGACLAFWVFAFFARLQAYVQAYPEYLKISTPFFKMKVSYRRLRSVHSAAFTDLFPPKAMSWADHTFLEPYFGKTAVVVEVSSFPYSLRLMRLFLPAQMFSPQTQALVLLVSDWMAFSTELDTALGSWLHKQKPPTTAQGWRRY